MLDPVGAIAWWLAERAWRHPLIWGGILSLAVWRSPVAWSHVVLVGGALALVAWVAPGTGVTRSRRVTSLLRWSTYRNRRRRIRRRSVKLWANSGLAKASTTSGGPKRYPKIRRARPHPLGVSLLVDASEVGGYVRDVISHADELCATVGARSLRAYPFRPKGGVTRDHLRELRPSDYMKFHLDFKFEHPFPLPISAMDLPEPTRPGFVVIGLNEDLGPMEIDPRMSHLRIGASGSGKSSELWTFLRALRKAKIPFRLRVFDPKGGTELRELEPVAYHYERLPSRWAAFMGRAGRALQLRQEAMRREGVRTADLYDPRFPLEIMVIDELFTAITMGGTGEMEMFGDRIKTKAALPTYISQVRSANAMVFALSVSAEKEVIEARDLFTYVACLRVPQQATTTIDMLFGAGSHKAYPAHELIPATKEDPNDAGIGWMRVEKEGVMMYRGGFLTDPEREEEARKIGEWVDQFTPKRAEEAETPDPRKPKRAPRRARAATTRKRNAATRAQSAEDGDHAEGGE